MAGRIDAAHANTLERATAISRALRATKASEATQLWNNLLAVKATAIAATR